MSKLSQFHSKIGPGIEVIACGNGSACSSLLSNAPIRLVIKVRSGDGSLVDVVSTAVSGHRALVIGNRSPGAPAVHDKVFPQRVHRPAIYSDPTVTTGLKRIYTVMHLAPSASFPALTGVKTVNFTPLNAVVSLGAQCQGGRSAASIIPEFIKVAIVGTVFIFRDCLCLCESTGTSEKNGGNKFNCTVERVNRSFPFKPFMSSHD